MDIMELFKHKSEFNKQRVLVQGKLKQRIQDGCLYLFSDELDEKLELADLRKWLVENQVDSTLESESCNFIKKLIEQHPSIEQAMSNSHGQGLDYDSWKFLIDNGAKSALEILSPLRAELPHENVMGQLKSNLYPPDEALTEDFFSFPYAVELEGEVIFDDDNPKLINIETAKLSIGNLRRYFQNKEINLDEISMSVDMPISVETVLNNQNHYQGKIIRLSGILVGHTSYERSFYLIPDLSYGWLNKQDRKQLSLSIRSNELENYLERYLGPFRTPTYSYLNLVNLVGEIEFIDNKPFIINLKEFTLATNTGVSHWISHKV